MLILVDFLKNYLWWRSIQNKFIFVKKREYFLFLTEISSYFWQLRCLSSIEILDSRETVYFKVELYLVIRYLIALFINCNSAGCIILSSSNKKEIVLGHLWIFKREKEYYYLVIIYVLRIFSNFSQLMSYCNWLLWFLLLFKEVLLNY